MFSVKALSAIVAATALASAAHANLVQNGDFETTVFTQSSQFNAHNYPSEMNNVFDWNAAAAQIDGVQTYMFLFKPGTATSTGARTSNASTLVVAGPGNGENNGFVDSPSGGNFIGVLGAHNQSPLVQMVDGLTIGAQYSLSFDWAAAQQLEFHGATTSGWGVSLGGESFSTEMLAVSTPIADPVNVLLVTMTE